MSRVDDYCFSSAMSRVHEQWPGEASRGKVAGFTALSAGLGCLVRPDALVRHDPISRKPIVLSEWHGTYKISCLEGAEARCVTSRPNSNTQGTKQEAGRIAVATGEGIVTNNSWQELRSKARVVGKVRVGISSPWSRIEIWHGRCSEELTEETARGYPFGARA